MTMMGTEKNPLLHKRSRNWIEERIPILGRMYCEYDMAVVVLNAGSLFQAAYSFCATWMSERQKARVRVFSDAKQAEPQALLLDLAPKETWPPSIGGTASTVQHALPIPWEDPVSLAKFKARKTAGCALGVKTQYPPETSEVTEAEIEEAKKLIPQKDE
eukprot:CAMPEP_0197714288 /NCGR_PEP_ID=MMETSP1338-20131121/130887_1 /TAXON_ID=43686 ORGANISM="Pelagodinium beii, Strain RCC1491" /NCGR_SAMPLE_ID=MMETSP1338 /ASSEMBLY_ACC=CAM_ASM_000754 /LENGTH=158 /DNA_ID=CAMNT_0043298233 /DNA_START=420 /DNA_END=893 /DNA_ORIENTATION=-